MKKNEKDDTELAYQLLIDEIEDYLGEKVVKILCKRVEDKLLFITKLQDYLEVK